MDTLRKVDSLAESLVDARPLLPSAPNSPWGSAEIERDRFARAIDDILEQARIRANVSCSQPGVYPPAVALTAWHVEENMFDRTAFRRQRMTISIDVNPYLTHPLIYTITIEKDNRDRSWTRWDVDLADVEAVTRFVLDLGPRPAVIRAHILEGLLGFIPVVNNLVENRIVEYARPPIVTLARALFFIGLAIMIGGAMGGADGMGIVLVGIVPIVVAWMMVKRRKVVHSVVKRPEHSPRSLFLVDSWHTSVPGVGSDYEELAVRLIKRLDLLDPSIVRRWEVHQYRTAYRIEEQKRLTLTKGQAVVHVHIYPVTDQAFVGWDGFLNWACWAETKPVSTTIRDGQQIEFRNLAIGPYVPTEFDLVEFNVLTDIVHGQIVTELRHFLREKEIEAEIDFTIIRGDRDRALAAGKKSGGSARDGSWRTKAKA